MKAIILAGGSGSRFKPQTNTIPKALLPVKDTTLLGLAIDQLPSSIDEVIITTKYLGEMIPERMGTKYHGRTIRYSKQPNDINGTWPAFYSAKEYIDDTELFCVLGCDDFFQTDELEQMLKLGVPGMGVTTTIMPAKYHGIKIDEHNFIIGLERHPNENREEPVTDLFANGFFILDRSVFSFEPKKLIDGEYGLPQTILAQKEYPLKALFLSHWQPCNTPEDLEKIIQS